MCEHCTGNQEGKIRWDSVFVVKILFHYMQTINVMSDRTFKLGNQFHNYNITSAIATKILYFNYFICNAKALLLKVVIIFIHRRSDSGCLLFVYLTA